MTFEEIGGLRGEEYIGVNPPKVDFLNFIIDTFATRDAMQRAAIKHLEGVVQQQALQLTWYQAHISDQPFGVSQ